MEPLKKELDGLREWSYYVEVYCVVRHPKDGDWHCLLCNATLDAGESSATIGHTPECLIYKLPESIRPLTAQLAAAQKLVKQRQFAIHLGGAHSGPSYWYCTSKNCEGKKPTAKDECAGHTISEAVPCSKDCVYITALREWEASKGGGDDDE